MTNAPFTLTVKARRNGRAVAGAFRDPLRLSGFLLRMTALLSAALFLSRPAAGQEYRMGSAGTITACGGYFLDSGGAQGDYSANEDYLLTICADNSGAGTHVQLIFPNTDIADGDRLCFYDGRDTIGNRLSCASDFDAGAPFIIQATAANPTGCLTIHFRSDGSAQRKGWSAEVNCVASCQIIQADLTGADPAVEPVDTGWIDLCPGQRFSLRGAGRYPQNGVKYQHSDLTSTFTWNFGDGNTAVGPEVSHAYRRSGGYIVQLTITDQFGCRNVNFISQRMRVSTRPDFTLGGDVPEQICAGDTVQLNAVVNRVDPSRVVSAVPTEGSFQFGGVRSDSLPLPDGTGVAYETSIEFTDFLPGQVLNNIDDLLGICLNIEHSWMRDLEIMITCPSGKSSLLHDHRGQTGGSVFLGIPNDYDDNRIRPGKGFDYCWTPDAVNPPWLDYANQFYPTTLPAGDYQSVEPLSNLEGCPLNGEWTLRVEDLWGQDNGFIFSWSINFNPDLFPNLETFTPTIMDYRWDAAPATLFSSVDSLAAAPVNAGQASYTFAVTDDFGCRYDTSVVVKVLPPSHPECFNCADNLTPLRDTALCTGESAAFDVRTSRPLQDEITFDAFPRYAFGFSNHPPGRPYGAPIDINSIAPATLTDPANQIASVCLDIDTDWAGDLNIFLRAPSGEQLELSTGNGGDGDNYRNTCFSPSAGPLITTGTAPFTGTFRPEGNWTALRNAATTGQWTLLVTDAQGVTEMGRLNSWSITFRSTNAITYTWTPAAGLSCTNCPTPVARPQATTQYVVTSADSYGCSYRDTVTVGIATDATPPTVECSVSDEQEITFFWVPNNVNDRYETRLRRNGGPGEWSQPGSGVNSQVFGDLRRREELTLELRYYIGGDPVNCDVRVSSASCTYQPCNFEISFDGPPQAASCFGAADGAVAVRASGGDPPYEFFIDTDPTPRPTGVFSGLTGGPHFVVVRDTGLCQDTLRFEVPQPAQLVITPEQVQQGCPGARGNQLRAGVSGGTAPYRYAWSNGQTTAAAVNLDSLSYAVTVTDANGCRSDASFLARDLPPFNPNVIQSSPSCFGFTDGKLGVNFIEGGLTQDPADYRFRWSTGDAGSVVENLAGGLEYTVTVTSREGCSVVVSRLLRQPQQITFDIVKEDIRCAGGAPGAATVTNLRGDNTNFRIQWDAAAGNQTSARAGNLAAGAYNVTVTDGNGCSASKSVTLAQPPLLLLTAKKTDNPCFGDEKGRIELDVSGGQPAYEIRWSTGAAGSRLEGLRAGNYVVSVTDRNGCLVSDTVAVAQPAVLQASLQGEAPTCSGFRDGLIATLPQGGTPPYLFSLDNKSFSGANTFVGLRAGNYQVYVRDAQGCLFTDRVRLDDPPEFTVSAGPDVTIILGDSLLLRPTASNAEGAVDFVWSAPYEGTLSCSRCETPLTTTFNTITYEVTATDARGCEARDFINVNVDKPRVVEVPTGFTPNNDGVNDRLLVHGRRGTRVLVFRLYDRWGELVFEDAGFDVNDPARGWDGSFRGQPLNSGVFIWYVEVEYVDGARDVMKGQTTLIR